MVSKDEMIAFFRSEFPKAAMSLRISPMTRLW